MFDPLNLGADVGERCLALALEWFKREGADTVADLCELPAGACKKLVDSLGLPPLKAQKLPKALEGASLAHELYTAARQACDVRRRAVADAAAAKKAEMEAAKEVGSLGKSQSVGASV